MSFDAATGEVAREILRHEFIELYAHHDADGIAAAAILGTALARRRKQFRLRIVKEITSDILKSKEAVVLCDLGSGRDDLPLETIVIDHHTSYFTGKFHCNPRLFGIDGELELSGAGAAYRVANHMGDNRDLSGLVTLGILGDGQIVRGENRAIVDEGIALGVIESKGGPLFHGKELKDSILYSINPYLPGISGEPSLLDELTDSIKKEPVLRGLLSKIVILTAESLSESALNQLYGERYQLPREVIDDAGTLMAIVDACGKTDNGSIGVEICMRSTHDVDYAWEIFTEYRLMVINAVKNALIEGKKENYYEIHPHYIVSEVADIFIRDLAFPSPVIVAGKEDDRIHISIRVTTSPEEGLGQVVHNLSRDCGGTGGGHKTRAGATIPSGKISQFVKGVREAVAV